MNLIKCKTDKKHNCFAKCRLAEIKFAIYTRFYVSRVSQSNISFGKRGKMKKKKKKKRFF